MNKILKIDSSACDDIRQQLETHLIPILKELGLNTQIGRMGYDNTSVSVKLDINLEGEKSRKERHEDADLRWAKTLFKDDIDFDQLGMHRGSGFKIVGYSNKAKRYPFIVQDTRGRQFKFSVDLTKKVFEKSVSKEVH